MSMYDDDFRVPEESRKGMDLERSAVAGLAAAGVAMSGNETVNPLMSEDKLKYEINRLTELQED